MFLFFFFKQKTAYEMRISDWSSDVCSSDLLLDAGADKVSINSAAVARPELVREAAGHHGSQCIVVALDARRVSAEGEAPRWEIFTHGGRKATGDRKSGG